MTPDSIGDAGWIALVAVGPLVLLMLTSFVKVSVVLSLLRNALGATDAPSGLVILGISLVLTFFVMAPVGIEMVQAGATTPAPTTPAPTTPDATAAQGSATGAPVDVEAALRTVVPAEMHAQLDALTRALEPLRRFLAKHASERDRATFVELAARMGRGARGDELWVLAPAFLTTELREAFAIAVLLFLPFLVIDLVVGLGLAALGMTSTSPQTVALPIKLLLFVAVDGWRLLVDSLLRGYV